MQWFALSTILAASTRAAHGVCLLRTALLFMALPGAATATHPDSYFRIQIVDEATGRGIPLVELETTNSIRLYTDSNGLAAFHEPGLMDQRVHFRLSSHGYEFPADGFGYRGQALDVRPGGSARLEMKRINIAERLYRITGAGVYRDTVLLGEESPTANPVLNGLVMGQDSIQTIIYKDTFYWFWGDTGKPSYPLGNFHMSGATVRLPGKGGLDPDVGVDLTYFVGEDGFSRQMAPRPEPGPVWLDAYVTLPDEDGRERMLAAYTRVTPAMEAVERGIMQWNDDNETMEKIVEFDLDAPVGPGAHPFRSAEGGTEYIWFPHPFPFKRVRAELHAFLDTDAYEAWTPLKEGSRMDAPEIDRDDSGRIRYAWRRNTPALDQRQQNELIKAGLMKPEEAWLQLQDPDTGHPVHAHSGSVYWNPHRGRWITIRTEIFGASMLGEIWYAEADTPLGPWVYARKILTHDRYSFYNPKQHPEFDKQNGRIIYFEGTYTKMFSGREEPTPRYDYNQVMYKLDLDDERLVLPAAVYRGEGDYSAGGLTRRAEGFATTNPASGGHGDHEARPGMPVTGIAFFAPDRQAPETAPVYAVEDAAGNALLSWDAPETQGAEPLFYALPVDIEHPPATAVPLYVFTHRETGRWAYNVDRDWSEEGYRRGRAPLCLVWRNPYRIEN